MPACEAWFILNKNTNHERGTRGVDEEFFMIFSWTHHVMELECQQK